MPDDLMTRAREGLHAAERLDLPADRYAQAHLAAMRATAALLGARSARVRAAGPRSVWEELPGVAPELGEWATRFQASGRRRLALERGAGTVDAAEADELVGDANRYLDLVQARLTEGA